jgi:hypothetical protein
MRSQSVIRRWGTPVLLEVNDGVPAPSGRTARHRSRGFSAGSPNAVAAMVILTAGQQAIWDGAQGHACSVEAVRDLSVVGTWRSSADERAAVYPCDGLIDRSDRVLFRAVDVDAPAGLVFRWLCQLRVAPYSYDWIDNLGRRSPRQVTEGLDELSVGQRFMTIFRLAAFEEGRSITLDSTTRAFGRVAVTYQVTSATAHRSRLVANLAFVAPRRLYGRVMRQLLPAGDLVMMRKQLLTLKALAERDATQPNVR